MRMNEVPKRDCFQKRMQQRLTSDMGLNEYCLGQYLEKLYQKSRIKMNKKEWSTKERLFQQRIQQRVLSNRDFNDYSLGQYPKNIMQKSWIKMKGGLRIETDIWQDCK